MKAADLQGSYEELFSNWRNKMHLAAETDNESPGLFGNSNHGDHWALARGFNETLEHFRQNCDTSATFENDYMHTGSGS